MNPTPTCATPRCKGKPVSRQMCQRCYGKAYRKGQIQPMLKLGVHSLSDIELDTKTAVCSICGPTDIRLRTGRGHECMTVRRRHLRERKKSNKKNPPTPEQRLRWKYGLAPGEYEEMLNSCGGMCEICGVDTDLVVDHCHATGKVRGLLCHRCNIALGWLDDRPETAEAAAEYLRTRPEGR